MCCMCEVKGIKSEFSFCPGRLLRKQLSGVRVWTESWTTAVSVLTVSEHFVKILHISPDPDPDPSPVTFPLASWALTAPHGTQTILVSMVFRCLFLIISESSGPRIEMYVWFVFTKLKSTARKTLVFNPRRILLGTTYTLITINRIKCFSKVCTSQHLYTRPSVEIKPPSCSLGRVAVATFFHKPPERWKFPSNRTSARESPKIELISHDK